MEAATLRERVQLGRRSARAERLRARLPRYLLWGFLGITSLIGTREIVLPEPVPAPPPVPDINVDQAAEDFAQRFTRAYLTYDAANGGPRERALRGMVPAELDTDAGYAAGGGAQQVSWTQVAQNQASAAGGRRIVVAAGIEGEDAPVYLAVPVERLDDGALRLATYPSFVGPPVVDTEAELRDHEEVENADVLAMTRRVLENYLAGNERLLAADLAPTANVSLPLNELRLTAIDEVGWIKGPNSGGVIATVDARALTGGTHTLSYELGVDRKAGRPVVTYVETVPNET